MCEANAFILKNGEEKLLLEGVDIMEPEENGQFRLVSIFGDQKIIKVKLRGMNLVNHKILFEEYKGRGTVHARSAALSPSALRAYCFGGKAGKKAGKAVISVECQTLCLQLSRRNCLDRIAFSIIIVW